MFTEHLPCLTLCNTLILYTEEIGKYVAYPLYSYMDYTLRYTLIFTGALRMGTLVQFTQSRVRTQDSSLTKPKTLSNTSTAFD